MILSQKIVSSFLLMKTKSLAYFTWPLCLSVLGGYSAQTFKVYRLWTLTLLGLGLIKINTVSTNVWCTLFRSGYSYGNFKPISGDCFANHINILRKTEVQTVILSCSIYLNLNCIKNYNRKHKMFHIHPFIVL